MASKFWVESNENPRARFFREAWAAKNEGAWKRHGNLGWQWFPAEVKEEVKKPKKSILRKNK